MDATMISTSFISSYLKQSNEEFIEKLCPQAQASLWTQTQGSKPLLSELLR